MLTLQSQLRSTSRFGLLRSRCMMGGLRVCLRGITGIPQVRLRTISQPAANWHPVAHRYALRQQLTSTACPLRHRVPETGAGATSSPPLCWGCAWRPALRAAAASLGKLYKAAQNLPESGNSGASDASTVHPAASNIRSIKCAASNMQRTLRQSVRLPRAQYSVTRQGGLVTVPISWTQLGCRRENMMSACKK